MIDLNCLPESIRRLVSGKKYRSDNIGMSHAQILVYDDCVLKIAACRKENEDTVRVMRWLEGRLPVPKVLCFESDTAYQYLLMSRVPGKMACDRSCMEHPKELVEGLAEAMHMLWRIDPSDCPRIRDIGTELKEAAFRVENRLVNLANANPGTFGKGGFRDPEALLRWLEDNRPDYDPVLSHGDFCLPNIFFDQGCVSGLIDLGATGTGDRWRDIALCYRSLKSNAEGAWGGKVYPDIRAETLFDALGVAQDPEKLRYYILLDELF